MSCGFDSLPAQSTNKYMINGIAFNLLVVGTSGIGKTTLINSLFDFDFGDTPDIDRNLNDIELRIKEYRPKNDVLEMKITIIETKGFDNNSCAPIVDYLTDRFDDNIKHELSIQHTRRYRISDSRVHCCIYMIPPTGLKAIDIVTLKQLHQKVCIILVIAKSDILTKEERHNLKLKIREEIVANNIEIYSPNEINWPLAVAASNDVIKPNSNGTTNGNSNDTTKSGRARIYPWGTMYIERDSEFSYLREFILKTNMVDLIDHTDHVHYDRYRDGVIVRFKRDNKRDDTRDDSIDDTKFTTQLFKPVKPPKPRTPMKPSRLY